MRGHRVPVPPDIVLPSGDTSDGGGGGGRSVVSTQAPLCQTYHLLSWPKAYIRPSLVTSSSLATPPLATMPFSKLTSYLERRALRRSRFHARSQGCQFPPDIVLPSGDTSGWVEVVQNDGGLTGVVTPGKGGVGQSACRWH